MSASHANVVALVNPKSGGQRAAEYVLGKLQTDLGAERVHVLFSGPDPSRFTRDAEDFLLRHEPSTVIVAGGDGTISFAMDVINDLHDRRVLDTTRGVVAPFPLGTGNDLSFTLGYGGGFARWVVLGAPRFRRMMKLFKKSKIVQLDRWQLVASFVDDRQPPRRSPIIAEASLGPPSSPMASVPASAVLTRKVMNNYFSVGFDAACAERLNDFRQRHPRLFLTRPIVKLWYAYFAFLSLFTEERLADSVTVILDGRLLKYPANTKGLVVANMLTYAGGSILWGPNSQAEKSLYQDPSLSDGRVEVLALSGVWHLAFVRLGLCYGTKLGQGERVIVHSSPSNRHQYDGEPLKFSPFQSSESKGRLRFDIRYFGNSDVLQAHLPQRHTFSFLMATLTVAVACCLALYKLLFLQFA